MAVNYGLLRPVNIAGSIMAGEQQAQQNQLAQQQAEMRQQEFGMRKQEFATQAEDRQLRLADYKTKQAGLDKFLELSVANGKTGSPKEMAGSFYEYAITQRDPQLIMSAQTMMQAADEREKYDAISNRQQPIPAQQTPAPMADEFGTGTALPGMFNALAQRAAPMASTNALAAPKAADPVAAIDSQIALYENLKDPRAKDKVARLQKQRDELTKRYTVGNTLMNQMGDVIGTAPAAAAKTIGTVTPSDFTPASVANFNRSGNYGDLVLKPTKAAGDGTGVAKAPSGYRVTATGNLEAIPGGPAASKPLSAAQEIKLRTDVAKDYKSAATTLSQMDDLLDSINKVKTAPGLSAATGYLGKLPSFSEGAAAQAESRLANLRGKVTALGKATAAMSGSIGSIANQEWKILSDQIAALDEVKGKGPLLEQIDLIEQQAKGAIERIRDQYDKTRSEDFERFPQFRDLPASKQPSGTPTALPNIDALLDKYLNKK
jgi:hypothetical protein